MIISEELFGNLTAKQTPSMSARKTKNVIMIKKKEHTDISAHASPRISSDHNTSFEDKSECGCSSCMLQHIYSFFLESIKLKPTQKPVS